MGTSSQEKAPATNRDKWWKDHTARRKERYNSDPDYREQRCLVSRESYRKNRGITLATCLDNLPNLREFGELRACHLTASKTDLGSRPCFTMGEFGEALGGHKAPVMYRWRTKGLIPEPIASAAVFVTTTGRAGSYHQTQAVYLLEEVREMVAVLGEHQKHFRYYRLSDAETIRALHERVQSARKTLGL